MIIGAHRGSSSDMPENTVVALAAAVELGCDFVEFDVRATRDGRLVVIHDERLDRTTSGTGRVRDRTLHDLRPLDAGRWMGEAHAGRKVPTLNETLAVLQGTAPFILDFKEESPDLVDELALSLRADDVLDRCFVTAPHLGALQDLAARHPDIRQAPPAGLARLAQAGGAALPVGLLLCRPADLGPDAVQFAADRSVKLLVSLPRGLDADECRRQADDVVARGAHGVLTDRPRAFLSTGLRLA